MSTPTDLAQTHRVVALINPPQSPFELAIASEVFGVRRPDVPMNYEFSVCSRVPGVNDTLAGYPMTVDRGLEHLEEADTIVIPGWEPTGARVPSDVLEALLAAHARGVRLLSTCNGAFVLAQTGLLDGRRATTHWRHVTTLAAQFPRVDTEDDVLFVDHGDVATSAGTAAGLDMYLHVIRSDHGSARAGCVARHLLMPPPREGDQRQHRVQPATTVTNAKSLADLLSWAEQHLGEGVDLGVLARRAHLSSRTLDRRFRDQLGISPGRWLLGRRVEAARVLLETTELTIDTVAAQVGLSSAANFRRRFHDAVGTTPTSYRRTFASSPSHGLPTLTRGPTPLVGSASERREEPVAAQAIASGEDVDWRRGCRQAAS